MPLDDGYGVVIGEMVEHWRDAPDDYGNYFHGHVKVGTPAGDYRCAIDVDTHNDQISVEWKIKPIPSSMFENVSSLEDGYHDLERTPDSGAVDYYRSPMLQFIPPGSLSDGSDPFSEVMERILGNHTAPRPGEPLIEVMDRTFRRHARRQWNTGKGIDALNELEPLLDRTERIFIFGEPFTDGGLGLHNVHQNQGDPLDSNWSQANGIWQDGCTIMKLDIGLYVAFLNKFSSQAFSTDENGNPL